MKQSIKLEINDHKRRRVNREKPVSGSLELFDNYFTYCIRYSGEKPEGEDALIWERHRINYRQTYRRSSLCGVSIFWSDDLEAWAVNLDMSGLEDIQIYFKTFEEGLPTFELMQKYLTE